jgi:hypothetical protein
MRYFMAFVKVFQLVQGQLEDDFEPAGRWCCCFDRQKKLGGWQKRALAV